MRQGVDVCRRPPFTPLPFEALSECDRTSDVLLTATPVECRAERSLTDTRLTKIQPLPNVGGP